MTAPRGTQLGPPTAGRPAACEHQWSRVAPVVHVVGDTEPDCGTYNAICVRCDERAWLHWPTRNYASPEA